MKVLVSQAIFPEGVDILERAGLDVDLNDASEPLPKPALIERLRGADGLVCLLTDRIDAEVIGAASGLRVIANVAVGYDNIDLEAARERGVLVTNTPGVLDDATADLTFALLLAAARRIPEADRYLRAGGYRNWQLIQPHLGLGVWGKTLGIVGMGRIGRAVARRAAGFAMTVRYHNRKRLDAAVEDELGARWTTFAELLRESDFVSVHTPLSAETRHLFGAEAFGRMKPGAVLINTARGPVIDEEALADALAAGRLRGAALDVFEREPAVHPKLLALEEHVVLVPHIGSATYETRRRMSVLAAENAVAALAGRRPPNLVGEEAGRTPER